MADLGPKKIGSNYQKLLQISQSGTVADGTGSAFALRLSGSSNVGIGTNPMSGVDLHVAGTISSSIISASTGVFGANTVIIGNQSISQTPGGQGLRFTDSASNELGAFQGDGYFVLSSSVETGGIGRPLFNMSQQVGSTPNVNIAQIKLSQINFFLDNGSSQWTYGAVGSGSARMGDFFINNNFTAIPSPDGVEALRSPAMYISSSTQHMGLGSFSNSTNRLDVSGSLLVSGPKGHITASGNISASGTIFASAFSSPDGDGDIDLSNSLDVSGNITASGNIWVSGSGDILLDEDQRIYFEKDKQTWIESNGANLFRIVTNNSQMLLLDHETGNRAVFGNGTKVYIGNNNNFLPSNTLEVDGNISSSGAIHSETHITASGNIKVNGNIVGDNSTNIGGANHITASGNISSSGTLIGNAISVNGGLLNGVQIGSTSPATYLKVDQVRINNNEIYSDSDLELNAVGNIEIKKPLNVSANISSSGNISASNFNLNGNLEFEPSAGRDITFGDNLSSALEFKEGAELFMRFVTTDGDEEIQLSKPLTCTRITASGNISSSNLLAGNITSSGQVLAANYLIGSLSSPLSALSLTGTKLFLGNSNSWTEIQYGRNGDDSHTFIGNITASANISSSGTIKASDGMFTNLPTEASAVSTGELYTQSGSQLPFSGSIAEMNNISASKFVLIK